MGLYSGSHDRTIKVWNTVSYECVCTMKGHDNVIYSLCLSEDGSRLYCGSYDKTIKCIATLQGHTNSVTSLCLSFKTNRLISASWDKPIRVWDTTTNTCIHIVTVQHYLESFAFCDNAQTLYATNYATIKSRQLTQTF
jgi:WD40 repeat protein